MPFIGVSINGQSFIAHIDSRSALSLLSKKTFHKIRGSIELSESVHQLRLASNDSVKPLGIMQNMTLDTWDSFLQDIVFSSNCCVQRKLEHSPIFLHECCL